MKRNARCCRSVLWTRIASDEVGFMQKLLILQQYSLSKLSLSIVFKTNAFELWVTPCSTWPFPFNYSDRVPKKSQSKRIKFYLCIRIAPRRRVVGLYSLCNRSPYTRDCSYTLPGETCNGCCRYDCTLERTRDKRCQSSTEIPNNWLSEQKKGEGNVSFVQGTAGQEMSNKW